MNEWRAHVERAERRYREGLGRLPEDADGRQKQLVRVANAAGAAGLAALMDGAEQEAREWFLRAAERYRESFAGAPAESWGRLIGVLKMRLLAGDRAGGERDARWALEQGPAEAESPIARYSAALAELALGADAEAETLAGSLQAEPPECFPREVADALAGLAARDGTLYGEGLARTLESFESRGAYLEDVPVADTVLVLEAFAEARGIAVRPTSPLVPARR